ncbi:MAG: DEAD/DEAH box helicase [Paludibacter sp.]|nr:DEAD/DEAH box helicase [Paludibacter sp.]
MNQRIAYTLNSNNNLGCFPECVVMDIDDQNKPATSFIKITQQNLERYRNLFVTNDELLIACCLKLEKEIIVSKIKEKKVSSWDSFIQKYFDGKNNHPDILYIRDYITDYINQYLNLFFENVADKKIFLPMGKFPFMWQQLHVELEMPEVFYCFEKKEDGLYFSLDLSCENKNFQLNDATLISRKTARVLLDNKIYEFDNEVDGAKLIPFLKKDVVHIPTLHIKDYLQKIVIPLITTNRVFTEGFNIVTVNELTKAVFRVKEIPVIKQATLFDDHQPESGIKDLVFELIFEYQDFWFWAGKTGALNRLDMIEDTILITHVERDERLEKQYIEHFNKIGIALDGKVKRMPYLEGVDWLNEHYKEIEMLDVEIRFDKKQNGSQRIFVGERTISIQIEESRDWFDIKGKVRFGEFEVPFLQVLYYIKQNRSQLLLPNGEYAQIPQAWFDEFRSLTEFCKFEDGKAVIAKQFIVLTSDLQRLGKVEFTVKENMRRLIENQLDINYNLPENFKGQLRNYQLEGYNWLRLLDELGLGGCLADDMGLGKTIQALCLLQWMKETERGTSLLVVPTSLVYNWQHEADTFCPELKVYVHTGFDRTKDAACFGNPDLLITSYAILRRDKELFRNMNFNYIILDEAQAIKNPKSDITQVCMELQAERFLTLTGTPLENSITDLWSQTHFINRNMLGSINHFTRACKVPEKLEMYRKLIKPFLLRRNKSSVLKELPEKTIIVQTCYMNESQQEFYRQTRNNYRDRFLEAMGKNDKLSPILLLEGLLRLRQTANHPVLVDKDFTQTSGKFETVTQMMVDVVQSGEKVLVFSSFVEHLKLYKTYLDERKIQYCYLDGSTKDRKEQVEKFQKSDDYPVFLLSLKAGGVGLNLTRASYVFLLDPWWNPAAEAQAFDRAHRIGQQNKVFVYKFITQNTIEEKILKLQEEKRKLFDTMIESETGVFKQLEVNEIIKLIE